MKRDRLRDQDAPEVLGYALDKETLAPIRQSIDTSAPGDYGHNGMENGMFRMHPSGDLVDEEEMKRRLKKK